MSGGRRGLHSSKAGFSLAATIGGGVEWMGNILGAESLAKQGATLRESMQEGVEDYQREIEEFPNPELFTLGEEAVGARDILAGIASSLPSTLALAASTLATAPLATAAGVGRGAVFIISKVLPRLQMGTRAEVIAASTVAQTITNMSFEAAAQYGSAKSAGVSEEEAERQAGVVGALNVGTALLAGFCCARARHWHPGAVGYDLRGGGRGWAGRRAAGGRKEEIKMDKNMAVATIAGLALGAGYPSLRRVVLGRLSGRCGAGARTWSGW